MSKKLLVLFTVGIFLALTACTSRQEEVTVTMVCVFEELHFGHDILPGYKVIKLDATNDRVNIQTETLVFDFEGEEDQIADFVDFLEEMIAFITLATVDAITMEIVSVTDTSVVLLTTTNFNEMSEEELSEYFAEYHFSSLESTIQELEAETATCTVVDNN